MKQSVNINISMDKWLYDKTIGKWGNSNNKSSVVRELIVLGTETKERDQRNKAVI